MSVHVIRPPFPNAFTPTANPRPPVVVDGEVFAHVGSYSHEDDRGHYEWAHYYQSASGRWAAEGGESWGTAPWPAALSHPPGNV